jgi:hypothetical protein
MYKNMDKTQWGEIRCQHCKRWFKSPIVFGNEDKFFSTDTRYNLTTCPHEDCRKITGCDRSNKRWSERKEEGHVTYIEGEVPI